MESLAPNPLSINSHSNALCVCSTVVIDRRTVRLEVHAMNTSANDCLVDYLLSDHRGFPCPAEFSNPSYSRSQLPQNPYALPFTSSRAQSRTQAPTTRPHSTCSSPPVFHWIRSERCPVFLMLSGDLSVSSLEHGAFLTSLRFTATAAAARVSFVLRAARQHCLEFSHRHSMTHIIQ